MDVTVLYVVGENTYMVAVADGKSGAHSVIVKGSKVARRLWSTTLRVLGCVTVLLVGTSPLRGVAQPQGVVFMNEETRARVGDIVGAQRALGVKLLTLSKGAKNPVISPYSIHAALTLARIGAREGTAQELDAVLFPRGYSPEVLQAYGEMNRGVISESPDVKTALANSLWIRHEAAFLPDFLKLTKQHFAATAESIDFRNTEQARARINEWVSTNTAGRIPELIKAGVMSPELVAALVNALYFKGSWAEPFTEGATKPQPFWVTPTSSVEVPMMRATRSMPYYEDAEWAGTTVSYAGGGYGFSILVPKAKLAVPAMIEKVSPAVIEKVLATPENPDAYGQVELGLPTFEVRHNRDLKEDLRTLGVKVPLSPQANFSALANTPVFIDAVVHESFVKVDEKGTEAAAATAVMIFKSAAMSGKPKKLIADRPFLFVLWHNDTKAPLFIGVVGDPRS